MLITRADLAKLIRDNAHLLNAPAGIDPVRLLWALAGNESGFGSNAVPRHEDSYCANKGGIYASAIVRLTRMWGCWAHCSYGPWQVMFDNESDVTPWQAESDPQTAILEAIRFLNAYVFGARGARTLREIADVYNDGHILPVAEKPTAYEAALVVNYAEPMPA